MQLQVECNDFVGKRQVCWTCDRSFEMQEAQVIICNDQGTSYGKVCPRCINKGFGWLSSQFERLSQPRKTLVVASNLISVTDITERLESVVTQSKPA